MAGHDAPPAYAHVGGRLATDLRDVTSDPSALDGSGFWAVVVTYEGQARFARFDHVRPAEPPGGPWHGPAVESWRSSLSRDQYMAGVASLREAIAAGEVYQANLCRVMSAPMPHPERADTAGLHSLLTRHHPAPHGGAIRIPDVDVVCASPETYLHRNGRVLRSSPIKGTGRTAADLTDKDTAENVMIVDLVRNDLGTVCEPGSMHVPELLAHHAHPGLVHLVSTVEGHMRADVGWGEILAGTFPPGSVTGAPKSSALRILRGLEGRPRGPYCGAVGWVDADQRTASLAVGIRTFWLEDHVLHFGTGAGITWGSDPQREWDETELKASRLVPLAAGQWPETS